MKKLLLLLFFTSLNTYATDPIIISDAAGVNKILSNIPLKIKDKKYRNLNDRLPQLGLNVKSITMAALQDDEIKGSHGVYKNKDILYTFFTNEPNQAIEAICSIFSSFSFIKRNNKWIAYDRTSNFLISGYKCEAP